MKFTEEWKYKKIIILHEIKITPHWSCTLETLEMNCSPQMPGTWIEVLLQHSSMLLNWFIINFLLYS